MTPQALPLRQDPEFSRLLRPRGVAVVGASADLGRIGGQPVRLLTEYGYAGKVYPVNPKYTALAGLACYPDIAAVPQPCDVAIIAVAAKQVAATLRQCGEAGIAFAIVFTAGFREIGGEGIALEHDLAQAVAASGVRVVGPNCIGIMNVPERIYMGFGPGFHNPNLRCGPVAFVSQSGGFAFSVVGLVDAQGIGFRYIVSGGNEADLTTLDFIEHFLDRDDVEVVVSYMEGIADGARLRAIGRRALDKRKPILIWKAGNSGIGRTAATSHTASMTADYSLYRAAFREGGFIEVRDSDDLADCIRAFTGRKLPRGNRIAVITTSGGSGVLMADHCDQEGLSLPEFQPGTLDQLRAIMPAFSTFANPADFTAQLSGNHELFNQGLRIVLDDPSFDQVIIRYGAVQGGNSHLWAQGIAELCATTDKPLLIAWSRPPELSARSLAILAEHRIPWCLTPVRTAHAAGVLHRFADKLATLRPAKIERPLEPVPLAWPAAAATLSEYRARDYLAAYGIPVAKEILLPPDALSSATALDLRFPVAVKVESPDIPHKTEAGAVRLAVADLAAMRAAAQAVVASARAFKPDARIEGVLVAEMQQGLETIVGALCDPYFGPVVLFGVGGITTELLKEVSYRFAPFDLQTAKEMIEENRLAPLFKGYRGRAPLDVDALAGVLSRLSWLIADHAAHIGEIDLNPVFVRVAGEGACVADALIVTRAA
ncbi:MAG: acetate--CoA ligase family protein [Burkholderiales bacterium]|nr:acetate--CoA ligase family protein [Burkholderiales bacterium]